MKILYLGPRRKHLIAFLEDFSDVVFQTEDRITLDYLLKDSIDYIVSYGYRHIIAKDIIDFMENKTINLHISYLPWNRGANPNFWSFLDNTKKGVTIHFIDEGIDTGPIIAQKEIIFPEDITLRKSYNILSKEIENLFIEKWPEIRLGKCRPIPQKLEGGTIHFKKDIKEYEYLLTDGWDTPVTKLKEVRKNK
ncbi:formyltransferase family protein [Lysinibacillus antri]|uniref:Formyl transferase n=1 Tax=Lysinibacillus antri TaxID=2498145 RepID=A0A432LD78_9BACI|nr:formyltransferase family protein [Lysinibacillus antri]RUL54194.1 formyl transferase [Lysinibacillus antri]